MREREERERERGELLTICLLIVPVIDIRI